MPLATSPVSSLASSLTGNEHPDVVHGEHGVTEPVV